MKCCRTIRCLIVTAGLMFALWVGGLMFFVAQINDYAEPTLNESLAPADAIVVLTGGSERITTGVALLSAGKGQKLFISGVHPGLNLDRVLAGQNLSKELRECCVVLGHAADNTIGNAEETANWIDSEGFRSMHLVTAHYHMPRSLLLFRDALSEVDIHPYPVTPDSVKLSHWWIWPGTSNLLVYEYNKYLFAIMRTALRDWLEEMVEALS